MAGARRGEERRGRREGGGEGGWGARRRSMATSVPPEAADGAFRGADTSTLAHRSHTLHAGAMSRDVGENSHMPSIHRENLAEQEAHSDSAMPPNRMRNLPARRWTHRHSNYANIRIYIRVHINLQIRILCTMYFVDPFDERARDSDTRSGYTRLDLVSTYRYTVITVITAVLVNVIQYFVHCLL